MNRPSENTAEPLVDRALAEATDAAPMIRELRARQALAAAVASVGRGERHLVRVQLDHKPRIGVSRIHLCCLEQFPPPRVGPTPREEVQEGLRPLLCSVASVGCPDEGVPRDARFIQAITNPFRYSRKHGLVLASLGRPFRRASEVPSHRLREGLDSLDPHTLTLKYLEKECKTESTSSARIPEWQ